MKKFNKVLVSLAVLSATGAVVLISCGGNKKPMQVPGVQVYARTNPDAEDKAVYYDDKIIEYKVDNAENLKYGETDVVVHIKPKLFFFLTDGGYDPETWVAKGNPIIPYVGLGSPTDRFSYELAPDAAWTFEEETSNDIGKAYKITIFKEFFKKNIVIAYGYAKDGKVPEHKLFPTVIDSELYKENVYNLTLNEAINLKVDGAAPSLHMSMHPSLTYGHADSDYYSFISNSSFKVVDDGVKIRYKTAANGNYANKLVTFKDVPTTFTDDETSYSNIKVLGLNVAKDAEGNEKITKIDDLTTRSNDVPFRADIYNPNGNTDELTVSIKWSVLARESDYQQTYDKIVVGMDPMYAAKVSVDSTSSQIKNLIEGYKYGSDVTVTEDGQIIHYSRKSFRPDDFVIDVTDGTATKSYRKIMGQVVESAWDKTPYFATFKYTGENWPTVKITYTNAKGTTSSMSMGDTTYFHTTPGGKEIGYRLVSGIKEGDFYNSRWELIQLVEDGAGYYAFYPTHVNSSDAFVYPDEWVYAKSISISIS